MPVWEAFTGPSYKSRSRTVADDKTVNLYTEAVESGTGKAKYARMQATQYNNLFFGQPSGNVTTPGMLEMTTGEAIAAPGATSFTVANGAGFVEDLGLFYAATGVQLTPIPSGMPVSGQYVPGAANTGTYTIAAADDALAFVCYYSYTITSGGTKIAIANQLMGAMPTY